MQKILNPHLAVTVSPVGAEMQSLKLRATGRELLWHGDPTYWHGRSPILFPAVGGLWNGHYRHNGETHAMPKHGFMRKKTWVVASQTPDSVTFEYAGRGEDREAFPWDYVVRVRYQLDGLTVRAQFEVENRADTPMYFQMGGHPGFVLPDFHEPADGPDGYLRLYGEPTSVLRAGEQGCTEPLAFNFPQTPEGLVPLGVATFANEALIFANHQVNAVTLLDRERRPIATVRSTAPVWLFWSPQGQHAPFVCAEPWYGLCDHIGFTGELKDRPFINCLEPAQTWHGGYDIEVLAE